MLEAMKGVTQQGGVRDPERNSAFGGQAFKLKLTARNLFYELSDANKEVATAREKVGTRLSWQQMRSFVLLGKGHVCNMLDSTPPV